MIKTLITLYMIIFIWWFFIIIFISKRFIKRYRASEKIIYSLIIGFFWPIITFSIIFNVFKKTKNIYPLQIRYRIKNESGDTIVQNVPYKDLYLWLDNPYHKYAAEIMNEKRSK